MNQLSSLHYSKAPINVSFQKVIEYPYHWHDCLEIVMVLEGSITLEHSLEDIYCFTPIVMDKNDIFILSINEPHRIYSNNDNVVLIIQINQDFIRKNFANITTLEFEDLLNLKDDKDREKIEKLKQLCLYLASLIIDYKIDNKTEIEKTTKVFLYGLIYNFNKINRTFSDNSLKCNRYLRIGEYLVKNAHHKNVLQEIAEQEHLSPVFISHETKQYFVLSFQEQINFYRVENAIKILLGTDKTICDIAYECGYSAPRYLYKTFYKRLSQNPIDFRKKYQKDYQNIKYINCYEEVEKIENYLKPNYKDLINENIKWLKINANSSGESFSLYWRNHLNILQSEDLLNEEKQHYLKLIQKEFGFQYLKLYDLFTKELQVFNTNLDDNYNWSDINLILDFINQISCRPLIKLEVKNINIKLYLELIPLFLKNIKRQFGNEIIKDWAFELDHNCNVANDLLKIITGYTKNIFIKEDIDKSHSLSSLLSNTIYTATYLIKEALSNHSLNFLQAIDCTNSDEDSKSRFYSLISENGLYKPSYHACSLLTLLGDILIEEGGYYIVTKKNDSLQILLYNHIELSSGINEDDLYNNYLGNKDYSKKINIFIKNINGPCKIIRYKLNNENGSIYYNLRQLGNCYFLNTYDINLLNNKISIPKITIDYAVGNDITFNVNLQPYSVELITLELIKS